MSKVLSLDKKLAAIFRRIAQAGKGAEAARKVQEAFSRLTAGIAAQHSRALSEAMIAVRDYWHETSRRPADSYALILAELNHLGYQAVAESFCISCWESLRRLPEDELCRLLPSPKAVDHWLKSSKVDGKRLRRQIFSNPDAYYTTALCDWLCAKGEILSSLESVKLAIGGGSRPPFLPPPESLLKTVLARDKKGVLAVSLIRAAAIHPGGLTRLISAVVAHRPSWTHYAQAYATVLREAPTPQSADQLLMPIEDLLSSSQPRTVSIASLIFAHIRTTLAVAGGFDEGADTMVGVAFNRVTMTVLHNAQKIGAPSLWLTADARKTVEELLVNKGKITYQGALEIALGLRATSAGLDPGESLKSIAFNLGIRPVGEVGSEVEYDPLLHEYEEGGLMPRERVRIVDTGWQIDDTILLRAKVKRN